jgi:transcriptional regulator with XRE-family HTH domain
MNLGKIIKQLRQDRNITQQELGKIINKSRSTIAGYETKRKEPDYETLKKIAEYFNVSTDYLLENTYNPIELADSIMFNKRLKYLREQHSLSQRQLSLKINVSQQTIASWETGLTQPSDYNLHKLSNLFSISIDYLLGKTNEPQSIPISNNSQKLSIEIHDLLIKKSIITKDEILTDEKIEWLRKLIGHAIDLSKM